MLRLLGILFLMLAVGLAVLARPSTPLGEVIFHAYPPLLNTLQAGVQRRVSPALWDQVFLPVLEAPSWVVPAVLGTLFMLLGQVRHRRV